MVHGGQNHTSSSEYDLPIRGEFWRAFFPKIAQANLSQVKNIIKMKYKVSNKNFSFYMSINIHTTLSCQNIFSTHYSIFKIVFILKCHIR